MQESQPGEPVHPWLEAAVHNLRTPLNVVMLASKVICDPGARPERRRHHAQLLEQALHSLNGLVPSPLEPAEESRKERRSFL